MHDAEGYELKIGQLVEILDLTLDNEGIADLDGLDEMVQFIGQRARVWYVGPNSDSIVQLELPGTDSQYGPYREYGWAGNWVLVVHGGLRGLAQRYRKEAVHG